MKNYEDTIYQNIYRRRIFYICFIIIFISIMNSINDNLTNIPELNYYNHQTLKLLVPSKKDNSICQKTIFFTSNYTNNSILDKYNLIEINNTKNSFVTYYLDDTVYVQYPYLFSSNGLIRSYNIYSDNNLILCNKAIRLIKENSSLFIQNNFIKIFRLFGFHLFSKKSIYIKYYEMKKKFNDDYNYMPETYYYPKDKEFIDKKFKNYRINLNDLWLVKPTNDYGGHGIKIFESLMKIEMNEYIITKYITNLDLIKNKKYDLRLYVLVTGLRPLRIYFYKEGLVRIATKNYTLNKHSFKDTYIHLTNVGINKKNKNYIEPNNSESENSNKWNLHTYSNHLKKLDVDFENIRKKINDIIIKSIISIYKNVTIEQKHNNLNDINFYILLGYDIIITKDYTPYLLEINDGVSMYYTNELEQKIKTILLVDTLNLVGLSIFSKNIIFKNSKNRITSVEENVNNAVCELSRPRGGYDLIFPLKENIKNYKKYFFDVNNEENELFWKIIDEKF